ncbi:helix-hairpin-helix domain-containing protein [Algoriphagus aestuarii]|nr:helix-hairpin-helix domain-containing protein [Algoriphagus aestuarii]
MKTNLFFWLKSYLGFSNKESRGFVLLIPVLMMMIIIPSLINKARSTKAGEFELIYQRKVDSLEKTGMKLVSSPDPVFNPQDTIKNKVNSKKSENLNRIPFSEADSITLQIVSGIGPSTAGRIVKYGVQLGGYYSSTQLLEVYGLKPETVELMWDYFDFDPLITSKIAINEIELDELSKHPYISYSEAKVILAYRNQHGDFTSINDLKKIKIFKSEWVDKIAPYLTF